MNITKEFREELNKVPHTIKGHKEAIQIYKVYNEMYPNLIPSLHSEYKNFMSTFPLDI